jgi:hypothetical protein
MKTTPLEDHLLSFIRQNFIGVELEDNLNGNAGRDFENKLENLGFTINRLYGVDLPYLKWEIKTRKASATSPQTIASMHPEIIIKTSYYNSLAYEKFKKQLRVYTDDNNKIISITLFDFDLPVIQDIIERTYEQSRTLLTINQNIVYTPYQGIGVYFEKTHKTRPEFDIRISDTNMKKAEFMSQSIFSYIFDYGV